MASSSGRNEIPTNRPAADHQEALPWAHAPGNPKRRKRWAEALEASKRRRGIRLKAHHLTKKVRKLDLFPEITKELATEQEERLQHVQECDRENGKTKQSPSPFLVDPSTNRPIVPRVPTEMEYAEALRQVQDSFRTLDHGSVGVYNANNIKIICLVEFVRIPHLLPKQRKDLDLLCDFLHGCKRFILPLATGAAPYVDPMSAIGWSPDMTRLKILDGYRNEEAIAADQEIFNQLMEGAEKAGSAIWNMWDSFTNVAAEKAKEYLKSLGNSSLSASPMSGPTDGGSVASLAFPSHGFHVDEDPDHKLALSELPSAFAMVVPTFKSTGKIALASQGHRVDHGQMIIPDVKIAIEFPPDTICLMLLRDHEYPHGTLKATEFGDSTRLGLSVRAQFKAH